MHPVGDKCGYCYEKQILFVSINPRFHQIVSYFPILGRFIGKKTCSSRKVHIQHALSPGFGNYRIFNRIHLNFKILYRNQKPQFLTLFQRFPVISRISTAYTFHIHFMVFAYFTTQHF